MLLRVFRNDQRIWEFVDCFETFHVKDSTQADFLAWNMANTIKLESEWLEPRINLQVQFMSGLFTQRNIITRKALHKRQFDMIDFFSDASPHEIKHNFD